MAETIPHILCIADSENFCIKYINRLPSGKPFESLIGKEIFNYVWPEYIVIFKQKIQDVKDSGKPNVLDLEITPADDAKGKLWYRVYISMVSGLEDSGARLMFLAENITESKRTELENINKSERIKAIINNTKDIICSIDCDHNLMEFNSMFATMVKKGYGIEMQAGMPVLQFVDPAKHQHLKAIYKRVEKGEIYCDIESFQTLNGYEVYNETSYNPIYDVDKKIIGINIFSKDITERVKSEQKIKSALNEKEVLLAEIHHRIKNNLAMVSSLLQLQEMNINNAEVKEALALSRKRIKSTALIHELLYRSESFQNIKLKDYLAELFHLLKMNNNTLLQLKGDEVNLNLLTAMPLGLMMNEIMLNSFKHSYNEKSKGQIEISIITLANKLMIYYSDFEGNFPDTIDFENSKTTGLTLIHTFAEQLNGSIEMVSKAPPKYLIQLPLNENQ
ncbi:MAG: histidine kinase dimerization/phosphoacceptor domain -containing protein [Bacteroidota bacterium]|nr:histidine kinase dimerization/phosphoacceptor domain -containing protein [Bacteroidota bacterium]